MIKQTYHFDQLTCHECAKEIVEIIESMDFISNVYINYDDNNITIESTKAVPKEEVEKMLNNIVLKDHEAKHLALLNNLQNIVTDEYEFEDIDCPNCALKVEQALNKEKTIYEAKVNYLSKKVIIKHLNNIEIYNIASKIVSTSEPGAKLIKLDEQHHDEDEECECHHKHHHHDEDECECHHEHHHHDEDECECHHEHHHHDEDEECLIDDNEHEHILETDEDTIVTIYDVEDIDCANCAAKIERNLNKQDNIIEASVNFIGKKIIVKHKKEIDVLNTVKKVLKATEPDAYIVEKKEKIKSKKDIIKKIILIAGIILFVFGLVIMHIGDIEITENLGLNEPILKGNLYTILLYCTFVPAYICLSYDLIYKSIIGIVNKDFFNESLLMVVASLGALCLSFFGENEFIESCAVILLYKFGEYFQDRATDRSKNAIRELIEMKKDTVTLKNGTVKNVKEVKVGEIITIKVGEQVPLDGIIKNGETSIDTKALTGESMPVFAGIGEELLSGSINLTKVIDVEVTKVDEESTMTKVLKLVDEATNQKSRQEEFIAKFARIYTPLVLGIALIVAIIESITGFGIPAGMGRITGALTNLFSILVISCPCALVISIPLGYFAGIGRFSKGGILVKGGNYIEALANAKTFVFDKTGTITKGNFKVANIYPALNHTKEEVLSLVAKAEQFSMHPIANAISDAYIQKDKEIENASVEEISGGGMVVSFEDKTLYVGNDKLMNQFNLDFEKCEEVGTILYLSVNKEFYGSIVIRDEIKEESYNLINYLNKLNYKTVILSGDNEEVVKYVANEVKIKEYKAKILPQGKYDYIDSLVKEEKTKLVYVGDGINDTPSLRRADVGIAMGGIGSDSAKECADIVIMNDDISKIEDAIKISKYTKKIIFENIVFALGAKIIALIIGLSGILGNLAMVIALFADVGVCIIDILNVLRILKYKNKKK